MRTLLSFFAVFRNERYHNAQAHMHGLLTRRLTLTEKRGLKKGRCLIPRTKVEKLRGNSCATPTRSWGEHVRTDVRRLTCPMFGSFSERDTFF